jgi:uncharacterized protein (TIGR02266 family)
MTDLELERWESELAVEEGALATEATALRTTAEALEGRVRAAQGLAADLAARGGEAAVAGRLKQLVVPRGFGEPVFEQARRAREAAVQARRDAAAAARDQLAASRRALSELSSQLQADEALARSQLEALRRSAEAPPPRAERPAPPAAVGARPEAATSPGGEPSSLEEAIALTVGAARPSQRREQKRVRVQTQVDLQSDANFYMGFSANISEGGIFVATVSAAPIGTEVDLSFSLPSGEQIACRGVVRWVREVNDQLPDSFPGLGVQFCDLDPEAYEAIRRFVSGRDPIFYVD